MLNQVKLDIPAANAAEHAEQAHKYSRWTAKWRKQDRFAYAQVRATLAVYEELRALRQDLNNR